MIATDESIREVAVLTPDTFVRYAGANRPKAQKLLDGRWLVRHPMFPECFGIGRSMPKAFRDLLEDIDGEMEGRLDVLKMLLERASR